MLYRNVSYFIVIIIVTYAILYIRVSRYPSLFHRSFYIYIYICVYTELSFETDRSSLFVANIRIYMYRNINIYKNTKKWEWGVGRGRRRGIGTLETLFTWQAKRITSRLKNCSMFFSLLLFFFFAQLSARVFPEYEKLAVFFFTRRLFTSRFWKFVHTMIAMNNQLINSVLT